MHKWTMLALIGSLATGCAADASLSEPAYDITTPTIVAPADPVSYPDETKTAPDKAPPAELLFADSTDGQYDE